MGIITVPSHVDLELLKVRQDSKRFELLAILDDPKACHADRLDLTRFLLGTAGYDVELLLEIIHYGNHWSNYSQNMTYNQVKSVAKWKQRDNNHISNSPLEGVGGEVPPAGGFRGGIDYTPKTCIIGSSRIICHYKKCESCNLVNGSAVVL